MNLSHEQARQAASQALDGLLPRRQQAALAQHLAECEDCRQYAARLEQADARLAQALPARWPAAPMDEPRMAQLLDTTRSHVRRNAMQTRVINTVRPFAWGLPVIVLVLLLNWSIRSLRSNPSATQADTAIPSAPLGDSSAVPATEVTTTATLPQDTPQGTPAAPPATGVPNPVNALVPGSHFRLQAELPDAPQQVTIYQQVPGNPPTEQQARQSAETFQIAGAQLILPESSSMVRDDPTMSNGHEWLYLRPFSGDIDYYNGPGSGGAFGPSPALPEAERVTAAEAFLRQVSALPADYRALPSPYDDKLVGFVPQVDGLPVYTQVGEPRWDWTNVQVDQAGVQMAAIKGFEVKPVGAAPILSAEQAWQRLLSSPTWQKARYAVINPANASAQRRWQPIYPPGQTIELYGYVHHTLTKNGQNWITFSDYAQVLQPDPQLFTLQQESTVHVWGQFSQDGTGRRWLQIERWEPSEALYSMHRGRLVREGGQSLIETSQGKYNLVPNVDNQLADGTELDISAFALKGDSLQWWRMESGTLGSNYRASFGCEGDDARGGLSGQLGSFGGGKLHLPQLSGLDAVPADVFNTAYPTGTQLFGQSGQLNVTIYRRTEGEQTSLALKIDPENGLPGGVIWLVEGALEGMQAYHGMPVQVWGTVIGQQDGWPAMQVERWIEQYPGVTPQRFVGTRSAGMVGGKMTVDFTTQDGTHYWLRSGLDHWTDDMLDEILAVGEYMPVEIEGFVIPGRMHNSEPVLYDIAREYPPDPSTTGLLPLVVDETGSDPGTRVTFTQVELAYLTADRAYCTQASPYDPRQTANLLLQPVWIFRGALADGRLIEVQVQALPDEFLN